MSLEFIEMPRLKQNVQSLKLEMQLKTKLITTTHGLILFLATTFVKLQADQKLNVSHEGDLWLDYSQTIIKRQKDHLSSLLFWLQQAHFNHIFVFYSFVNLQHRD